LQINFPDETEKIIDFVLAQAAPKQIGTSTTKSFPVHHSLVARWV